MIKKIRLFIKKHQIVPEQSTIVLGLSGGPDSVFLLHLLATLKQEDHIKEIIAAHLDHEWRTNSDKDAQFCTKITKKYNIPLATGKISELDLKLKFKGSKEEFGRKARRHFFQNIKKQYNADLIALAHHAQDQQETFFIRLIRGSSLSGLTAMKPIYGHYIRPLLETNKEDIIAFLEKHTIPYLTDPSNTSQKFLRNRIRAQVIPALKKCDTRFDDTFKKTIDRLQKTEQFLEQLTQKTFNKISTKKKGVFYINIKSSLHLHPTLLYRVLMHWLIAQHVIFPVSENFLNEIIKFLKQPGSKNHQLHHDWYIAKKKGIAHIKVKT